MWSSAIAGTSKAQPGAQRKQEGSFVRGGGPFEPAEAGPYVPTRSLYE